MISSSKTRLTTAIADFIIYEDMSFNLDKKPRFKKFLHSARNLSKVYHPPNIKLISKDLIDVIHDQNMKRNLTIIKKESYFLGLFFIGDGATMFITPFLNILVSGKNIIVAVLELVNWKGHLGDGEKNVTFIFHRFLECMKTIDPTKSITDVVMFDGGSNVQLGVDILKIQYSKLTVMRGVEHSVYPLLSDVSKLPILNQMIQYHKTIYNLLGSEIYHKPDSVFKSKLYEFHNSNIGLFSVNDTIMSGYFTEMHRNLCTIKLLVVNFSSAKFSCMTLNSNISKIVI